MASNTNLKPVYIVRYADDFKLFCKNKNDAERIFKATEMWLNERLGLEISPTKSKIVNLKNSYSQFLGFKMKLHKKSKKWVIKSHMKDKAKERAKTKIKEYIKQIEFKGDIPSVMQYNACILGLQNYYCYATNVNLDFADIAFIMNKTLKNRLRLRFSKTGNKSKAFQMYYNRSNWKVYYVNKIALFQIPVVRYKSPMCFQQDICNYTKQGRDKIHNMQKAVSTKILNYIMENPVQFQTAEFNDNRISLYVGQAGICGVSKTLLEIGNMEVHHKVPKEFGGGDEYNNLIFITSDVHKLIHATNQDIIQKYLNKLNLDKKALAKLNKLRLLAHNYELKI